MFEVSPISSGRVPKAPELVADQIRTAIINGALPVGSTLPTEGQLVENLGVSRPTVREAMRILESEKFITITRGARGGAIVCEPTSSYVARSIAMTLRFQSATVADVYDARIGLEGIAARFAATYRPAEASAVLRQCVEAEFTSIDDLPNTITSIARVHLTLLEQCGNLTLALVGAALHDVIKVQMTMIYHRRLAEGRAEFTHAQLEKGFQRHGELADLIAAGKAAEAEDFWTRHMQRTREFWVPEETRLEMSADFGA